MDPSVDSFLVEEEERRGVGTGIYIAAREAKFTYDQMCPVFVQCPGVEDGWVGHVSEDLYPL